MINKITKEEENRIAGQLLEQCFQNPYLYIDATTFGFSGPNIDTWLVRSEDKVEVVLYRYYDSLQICVLADKVDGLQIAEFIREKGFKMVSGTESIIRQLSELLPNYKDSYGVIMGGDIARETKNTAAQLAGPEECGEIAELICSDTDIGGHYNVAQLQEQLQDRMLHWNCVNVVVKEDGKIVAHAATYADCPAFAILGGLITHSDYRGKGYGGQVLEALTKCILEAKKKPLLYCYNPETIRWYRRNGWEIICNCGKIEERKHSL